MGMGERLVRSQLLQHLAVQQPNWPGERKRTVQRGGYWENNADLVRVHTAQSTATIRRAAQAASGFVAVLLQDREQLYFCVLSFWEMVF